MSRYSYVNVFIEVNDLNKICLILFWFRMMDIRYIVHVKARRRQENPNLCSAMLHIVDIDIILIPKSISCYTTWMRHTVH